VSLPHGISQEVDSIATDESVRQAVKPALIRLKYLPPA
jgi:hypothetical protein